MHVRVLTADDLEAFRGLHRFALTESPHAFVETVENDVARPDQAVAEMLALGQGWGAFEGERMVGQLVIDALPYARLAHTRWLHAVYLHPDARGSGAGRAMLLAAIEHATAHGARRLAPWVSERNLPARNAYERLGFVETGRVPGGIMHGGDQVDDVLMCLKLRPSVWTGAILALTIRPPAGTGDLRGGGHMELVDQVVAYLREGFANINNPKGLLIALAATVFMGGWKQLFPLSLVAVVVHIAIEQLAPVLAGEGGAVVLPDLTSEAFWTRSLVLFLGYLIIIGIFYFVKSLLFRRAAH